MKTPRKRVGLWTSQLCNGKYWTLNHHVFPLHHSLVLITMSPSLLRSRCAHTFRMRWPGNGLPVERFGAAAAPLAQVIRRWFRGSKSVFHLIQTARMQLMPILLLLLPLALLHRYLPWIPNKCRVWAKRHSMSPICLGSWYPSSPSMALVSLLKPDSHLAPKGSSTIINHPPYHQ